MPFKSLPSSLGRRTAEPGDEYTPRHLAARHGDRRRRPWGVGIVLLVNLLTVAALINWLGQPRRRSPPPSGWSALDVAARCADAASLVAYVSVWPLDCQWRSPGQTIEGEAFPPPVGDPPWDHPRIVIYVARTQSRAQVARVIAHEMGHMYLTRTASDGPAWVQARGLPHDTPAEIWVEDYAEVFAAVYGPDLQDWQGAGSRPSPAELRDLATRFFLGPPVPSR